MKNILLVIALFFVATFSACIDTEESIVINTDNSGIYTVTADMSKFLGLMNNFKSNKENNPKSGFSDSTVYFKDIFDQSNLTATEKDLYRAGSFSMKINEKKAEGKVILSCPFKNMDQLLELKMNLFAILNKLDPKKEEMGNEDQDLAKTISPFADQYKFDAKAGSITNTIINLENFKNKLASDSTIESMKGMQATFGEPKYKTVFKLPKPVKKYNGPNVEVSKDKKTISFLFTQKEMIDNPAETVYSIEY